jgi:hypothetical protein
LRGSRDEAAHRQVASAQLVDDVAAHEAAPPVTRINPRLSLEVLPVARRGRAALALVLRADLAGAVRRLGRLAQLDEGDLADLHPG